MVFVVQRGSVSFEVWHSLAPGGDESMLFCLHHTALAHQPLNVLAHAPSFDMIDSRLVVLRTVDESVGDHLIDRSRLSQKLQKEALTLADLVLVAIEPRQESLPTF
jgi:hypothetical protein